jgi:hypothetical protein
MAQQLNGEFASANPTNGMQDVRLQKPRIRPNISLNKRRNLQHFERPATLALRNYVPGLPRV